MNDRWRLSRRQFLRMLAASGAIAAGDLAWWEEPFLSTRKAYGAAPVRFQFSVPEPKRTALVESLVQRFNQSQSDFEARVEFVPQAQARQKLITSISAGNPPDCCQVWDYWVGEFARCGYACIDVFREKYWSDASFNACPYYVANAFLYVREGHELASRCRDRTVTQAWQLRVVHPRVFQWSHAASAGFLPTLRSLPSKLGRAIRARLARL